MGFGATRPFVDAGCALSQAHTSVGRAGFSRIVHGNLTAHLFPLFSAGEFVLENDFSLHLFIRYRPCCVSSKL